MAPHRLRSAGGEFAREVLARDWATRTPDLRDQLFHALGLAGLAGTSLMLGLNATLGPAAMPSGSTTGAAPGASVPGGHIRGTAGGSTLGAAIGSSRVLPADSGERGAAGTNTTMTGRSGTTCADRSMTLTAMGKWLEPSLRLDLGSPALAGRVGASLVEPAWSVAAVVSLSRPRTGPRDGPFTRLRAARETRSP
jgi:hypothetical protein